MAKPALRVLRTGGLWFDGVSGYVLIPHSNSLDLKTALTLMAWVYRTRVASEWVINKNYNSLANTQYGFYIYTDHTISLVLNGVERVGYLLNIIGKRTHIACTWDGLTAKIYVDGVLKAAASYSAVLTSQPYALTIACRKTAGGVPGIFFLRGMTDDVLIYNRALTDAEIYEIYSKGTFIKDGLVLYLPFYESEGDIAHDVSGYGNHGTIYGGAMWVVKKALRVLPKAR